MLLSLVSNAKAFEVRRTYVLVEMSLRFNTNAKAFWGRENKGIKKGVPLNSNLC